MRFRKRIFPFVLSVLLVFSLFIPIAYASNPVVSEGKLFWDWISLKPYRDWISAYLGDGVTSDTATSEDWQAAYDNRVQNSIVDVYGTAKFGTGGFYIYPSIQTLRNSELSDIVHTVKNSSACAGRVTFTGTGYVPTLYFDFANLVAPVDGYYTFGYAYSSDALSSYSPSTYLYCNSRKAFSKDEIVLGPNKTYTSRGTIWFSGPAMERGSFGTFDYQFFVLVEPYVYDVNDYTLNIGGVNSRTGSITGDFGIMGDNNTITKADKNYIVNETDNSVYNPVTNTTSTVTSWDYDYSTRSYNVTLDSGAKQTITYGDEKVTIQEGDTVYNVYYMAQDGGTVDPTESTSPVDPSGGGDGVWDKLGTLIGSILGGVMKLVGSVVAPVLDALTSLVTMLTGRIGVLVEAVLGIFAKLPALFTGFLGLLTALFPFLPADLIVVLEFGLIASVFVGLFLLIFRR